jgi:hypothetical protein
MKKFKNQMPEDGQIKINMVQYICYGEIKGKF